MPSWPTTSLPMTPLVGTLEITSEPNVVEFKPDVFSSMIRGRRYTGKAYVYNAVLLLQSDDEKDALDNFFSNDCADGALPFDMNDWVGGESRSWMWIGPPAFVHVALGIWRASVQLLRRPIAAVTPAGVLYLGDETDGMAIDFLEADMFVKDLGGSTGYSGDPFGRLTFTRASAAWYHNSSGLVVQAAVNEPRYDYNISTLALRGFLMEEQRINICLHASDFTNAAWSKTTMTAAKTATGPDGVANSASTLTATSGNATALQSITSGSATRISSMYVKRRTGSGVVEMTQNNGSTWTPVTVTSQWTRVEIPSASAANPIVGVRIVTSGDAIDVAFFQHEVGAFITSPILTTTASVTRSQDVCNMAISGNLDFNPLAGTLVVEAEMESVVSATNHSRLVCFDDNVDFQDSINLKNGNTATQANFEVQVGGSAQANININSIAANTPFKLAGAWAANDFAASLDGGAVSTDASGSIPTVTHFRLGNEVGGTNHLNGWLRRVKYLPRRATNTELQAFAA